MDTQARVRYSTEDAASACRIAIRDSQSGVVDSKIVRASSLGRGYGARGDAGAGKRPKDFKSPDGKLMAVVTLSYEARGS
jgi:hypothetical protein